MSVVRSCLCLNVLLFLVISGAAGCSSSEVPAGGATGASGDLDHNALPMLAIAPPVKDVARPAADAADEDDDDAAESDDDGPDEMVAPKEGTPEWNVHEATRLLLEPPPKSEDVEVLKKHRKERNEKIIELSQAAIKEIHGDKEKERLFTMAVHNLMEARLQRALTGDRESIDLLYEDAAALAKRNPKSRAAAEGAHSLVNLAYNMAKDSPSDKPRWLKEFSRQARQFALGFPEDERRALPFLFTAGRSCELAGMTKEALDCYSQIQKEFSKSAFADRVGPMIRRLKLNGNPPQLAGPTIDGDQLAVDDLLGKVILVVFWSTEIKPFHEQLPTILAVSRKESRRGLRVIGVNLDLDAAAVQQFVVEHKITWPQIFYPESEKRGWNHPLIESYGIMDVPALWLIDQSGNVVSTAVKIENLAAEVAKLLDAGASARDADTPAKSQPATGKSKTSLPEAPREAKKLAPVTK